MSRLTEPGPEEEVKKPDFIITNDGQEYMYGSRSYSDSSRQEEEPINLKTSKSPLALRFLCLLGVIFTLIFAVTISLWLIVIGGLATLFLFQNEDFNRSAVRFLKLFKNTLVITFALLVALFSPTLGFGLLILYFTLKGETKDRDLLRGMLKRFL